MSQTETIKNNHARALMNVSIDEVWKRIKHSEGQSFRLERGKQYRYEVVGNSLTPVDINRNIPRSDFAKALALLPLEGPALVQHLQGPSYIYSILMDRRIRGHDEWGSKTPQGIE